MLQMAVADLAKVTEELFSFAVATEILYIAVETFKRLLRLRLVQNAAECILKLLEGTAIVLIEAVLASGRPQVLDGEFPDALLGLERDARLDKIDAVRPLCEKLTHGGGWLGSSDNGDRS